jgi:hypothetical protein
MEDIDLTQASDYDRINHYAFPDEKIPTYNPFDVFVKNNNADNGSLNSKVKAVNFSLDYNAGSSDLSPIRVSTKEAQPYISKGFKLTDLDLHGGLENELSSSQSYAERKWNNLKNAGANLVSMAVVQGMSNPTDLGFTADLGENTIAKKLFDWSTDVQKNNYNYQTKEDDEAKGIWE